MSNQIFDSYLFSTNQFHDFDEMAIVAASAWDQRYRKVGKGQDRGFVRQLNMPAAQLSHIGWRSGLLIETGTPTDAVGLVIQVAGNKRLRMNGQVVGKDEIAVLHSPRDYDLLNGEGTTFMVLAVDAGLVLRHAQAHWGRLQRTQPSAIAAVATMSARLSYSFARQKPAAFNASQQNRWRRRSLDDYWNC